MDEKEYNSADIIKRLRAWSQVKTGEFPFGLMDWAPHCTQVINDAANEIEGLRKTQQTLADAKLYESAPSFLCWRSMETAPKDKPILAIDASENYLVVQHRSITPSPDSADIQDGCEWFGTQHSPYADYAPSFYPTHWQPLLKLSG